MQDVRFVHYQLWTWLAKNPSKSREDWPNWIFIENNYIGSSPVSRCLKSCKGCPIFKSKEYSIGKLTICLKSTEDLYLGYIRAKNNKNWILVSHFAEEIAKDF